MLKHCLIKHEEKNPDEVKFGMRLRQQFKTALERQVAEAVAIFEEKERGTELMNSKSEFNRCALPRIQAGDSKELLEQLQEEDTAEKEIMCRIRCMLKRKKLEKRKKKKKEKEKESNEEKKETLEEICEEILEENDQKWKRRKLNEEVIRKMEEMRIEKII